MAGNQSAYLIITPNPARFITDANNDIIFYVKFGDGGNNENRYKSDNPDFSFSENIAGAGAETWNIGGREVQIGKYLEHILLMRFNMAWAQSEWHKIRANPGVGAAVLALSLIALQTAFRNADLDPGSPPPIGQVDNEHQQFIDGADATFNQCRA